MPVHATFNTQDGSEEHYLVSLTILEGGDLESAAQNVGTEFELCFELKPDDIDPVTKKIPDVKGGEATFIEPDIILYDGGHLDTVRRGSRQKG